MEENKNEISRRTFIRNSSIATVGLIGSVLLPTENVDGMPSTTENVGKKKKRLSATRKLGPLEVSSLAFGCMNMTGAYGPIPNRADSIKLVQAAVDLGVTFFDTAQSYGSGLSEEIVGEALEPYRNKIVIATKFGYDIDPDTRANRGLNSSPGLIKKSVEGSLRRLRTDYIDLFYQHRIDPKVPIEEVAGTVKELIKEGKVKYWGLSESGAATMRRAHAVHPLAAVTNEYSVWTRDPEGEVIGVCEELNIGLSPWSPTGPGFLSGTITESYIFDQRDFRASFKFPRFTADGIRANLPIVELLRKIGLRYDATPVQVALNWLLMRKAWIAPIPGTTSLNHLKENYGALKFQLDDAAMKEIESGIKRIGVHGDRFPPSVLALSDTGAILGTSSIGGTGKSPLPK